jgi:SsrA-binding protein
MQRIFLNKRAAHGVDILDKLETGIVLKGWEVKSVRAGRIDVSGAFVDFSPRGELHLMNARIPKWDTAPAIDVKEQIRSRKLLAGKSQAAKLGAMASRPGYTLIPLAGYVNDKGLIKIEIALIKGKKKYEKRQLLKERDMERQINKDIKNYK